MKKQHFPRLVRTSTSPRGYLTEASTKVIFHHLPKTAGSTFRRMLDVFFDEDDIFPGEINDEVINELKSGSTRKLFAGHFTFDLLDEYFHNDIWLVFLRDPIDRLISNYYNLNNGKRHTDAWLARAQQRPETLQFLENCKKWSLQEYLESDDPRVLNRITNYQTRHLVPFTDRSGKKNRKLVEYDKSILEEAKRNLSERFEFVGIQELFGESMNLFAMTFGTRPIAEKNGYTDNINPSKHGFERNYREELSDELLSYLERRNQMDLELLTYARELMQTRMNQFLEPIIDLSVSQTNQYISNAELNKPVSIDKSIPLAHADNLRGFYRKETTIEDVEFFWSGFETPSIVDVYLPAINAPMLKIEFTLVNVIDPNILGSLEIKLNDEDSLSIDLETTISPMKITASFATRPLGKFPAMGNIKIYSPTRIEDVDIKHARALGIAIHSFKLIPSR